VNTLVITVACADNLDMDRMRQLGTLVAAEVRRGVQKLERDKVVAPSELMIGTPGFAIVLGMTGGKHRTRQALPSPIEESEDEP
jgi:hypothetical protein